MIDSFSGKYNFLSNFYETPIYYKGLLFQSTEAAFQSQKCKREEDKLQFCNLSPGKAKRLGRQVQIVNNWDKIKDRIMFEVCLIKFLSNNDLKNKLLATKNEELIEGNYWNDCYWGVCKGKGLNKLGKILMEIRTCLKEIEENKNGIN